MRRDGFMVLHVAANQNHAEVVKMLLELGADVNAETR